MKKILLSLLVSSAFAFAGDYPLKTCVVSGDKLGDMGENYTFTSNGVEVRLCCKKCKETFDKDPGKYLSMITQPAKSCH